MARRASGLVNGLDTASEANVVDDLRPREFPRVAERQPVFRVFLLPSVLEDLAEQPVIITDAIAVGRDAEACHALQETGGEAPQTAIPERGIGLG